VGSAVESATDRAVAAAVEAAVEAAVAEAVTSAVADAVGTGLESLTSTLDTTVNRVAPSTPDLTAGMVSAVAATLDEFGTRVDHDLDTMADRLERLSDVLERVVVTVDEVVSRRRGVPSEAIVLLRQVAAETTEQIRTDNRSRRGGAGGAFPTPPSAEQG
jgi:hypothetical protein